MAHGHQEVVAHVVLRPGADTQSDHVISHGRAQLAAYKYPRDVVVHAELPKGPSGKILKRELRDPYWHGRARQVN